MKAFDKIHDVVKASLATQDVFYADLRPEWGSENAHHRLEIRKGILEFLKQYHPDQIADSLWDMDAPPVLKSFFVSISHCQGMGGFVLCSKSIGLDVELKSRITAPIVERVSSEEEIKNCPQRELLWTAKEAVFKCSPEFYTIGHILIGGWQKSQNETYSFSCLTAHGWAFIDSDHSYALAVKKA